MLLNKYATNKIDFHQVTKAIYYAKKYHSKQKRKTGELFYTHTLEVAYMVANIHLKLMLLLLPYYMMLLRIENVVKK